MIINSRLIKYFAISVFSLSILSLFIYSKVEASTVPCAFSPVVRNTSDTYQDDRCTANIPSAGYFSSASGSWNVSGAADGGTGHIVLCVLAPGGTEDGTRCVVNSYFNTGFQEGTLAVSCGDGGSTLCDQFSINVQALKTVQLQASASGNFVPASAPVYPTYAPTYAPTYPRHIHPTVPQLTQHMPQLILLTRRHILPMDHLLLLVQALHLNLRLQL